MVEVSFKPEQIRRAVDKGWDEEKQAEEDEKSEKSLNLVDLDDDSSLLTLSISDSEEEEIPYCEAKGQITSVLLRDDVHNIPGSPWAKPRAKHSPRPTEPLAIAKYASTLGLMITIGWIVYLFVVAVWSYSSLGRIIVEVILSILSFFGLFWNSYFTVSSICKCFIPADAFRKNGKYVSFVPEQKYPTDDWLSVTIQIPVYKESLADVLGPTLKSCIAARDHYHSHTGASCNIVVCEDGMMAMLRDNFSAAEMLWENVRETKGHITNINDFLKRIPRIGRRHLKGLRSGDIVEVFHRMLFYYHYRIGFVARSTLDRRGKFKKASNLNAHLRLVFGAQHLSEETNKTFQASLLEVAHNDDGSRDIMFGNDINIGSLIVINDADARMQPPVIMKTVPEFLNNKFLGFTQHATKTMDEQRGESCYLRLLEVYTDALYQGHFLLSSIMGCHPPLVGHSVFIRTEAIRQCGRMRMLRKAQHWLDNIGLPFLGVDQLGFGNLQSENRTEYWSESHVSEDFELMIHLYNLGYSGRYVAFPDCEFQEGVTRTFDEEAGRHRKFSLGAHELMFNPIQDILGHGIRSPLFRTFLSCDIPSYYKIYLTAYLHSYTAGGIYVIVFTFASIARLLDSGIGGSLYAYSPVAILVLNMIIYYVIGYATFLIALVRMHSINRNLFFPEYRMRGKLYLIYKKLRYSFVFQFLFYSVMGNYFFLGGMDHMMSKPRVVGATNKDVISASCCAALKGIFKFNSGAWTISLLLAVLAVATLLSDIDYDVVNLVTGERIPSTKAFLFAGPTIVMSIMGFLVPFILNPYVWCCPRRAPKKADKKVQLRPRDGATTVQPNGGGKKVQSRMDEKNAQVRKESRYIQHTSETRHSQPKKEVKTTQTQQRVRSAHPPPQSKAQQSPKEAKPASPVKGSDKVPWYVQHEEEVRKAKGSKGQKPLPVV